MMRVVDRLFADEALAPLYDLIDDDRSDLLVYAELVDELGVSSLIDLGAAPGRSRACLRSAANTLSASILRPRRCRWLAASPGPTWSAGFLATRPP
jgi:hypothetical protein